MDPWMQCLRAQRETEKIENGISYEKVEFDFSAFTEAVIPDDAQAHLANPGESPGILVEKHQTYQGEPPRAMDISNNRRDMGVAYMISEQSIAFATYGTWVCEGGGGSVKLHFRFPKGIHVSKLDKLTGMGSLANLTPEGKIGPSFGGAAAGWTMVKTEPDLTFGHPVAHS